MNLFVLGNGFDLAHNLPTKYWDFRMYLLENHNEFLNSFEEAYNYFSTANLKNFLWNDLESNLASIDDIMLVEKLYQQTDLGLESGNVGILDTMDEYFTNQFSYIEDLAIYLKKWANEINLNIHRVERKTDLLNPSTNSKYINFNYTNTLSIVYEILCHDVIHIHGSASEDEDLVLGHADIDKIQFFKDEYLRYEEVFDEQNMSVYNTLYRYCDNTIKDTKFYISLLEGINFSEVCSINIVGHSLGEVDMPYFLKIFQETNDINWNIYYFSEHEISEMRKKVLKLGVNPNNINFIHCSKFYNIPISP